MAEITTSLSIVGEIDKSGVDNLIKKLGPPDYLLYIGDPIITSRGLLVRKHAPKSVLRYESLYHENACVDDSMKQWIGEWMNHQEILSSLNYCELWLEVIIVRRGLEPAETPAIYFSPSTLKFLADCGIGLDIYTVE